MTTAETRALSRDPEARDAIAELIGNYNELNGSTIEELFEEPSPLEFMRFVAKNTPFVIRTGARDWAAIKSWDVHSLAEMLKDHQINVAVTPHGNADAPTPDQAGDIVFAKPHEEKEPFNEFLDHITRQEFGPSFASSEVRYAQTQNDNLRHEYSALFDQVLPSIPFARIALQRDPDAINLWIGNSRSVTALHRDNYENLYVQVAGRKHFVLFSPLCQPCVNEQLLKPARYTRSATSHAENPDPSSPSPGQPTSEKGLALQMDKDENGNIAADVPFATWDPDRPNERATSYSHLASPMRVTLEPGDMLYLPAMWYHKVSQSCSKDGICVAVNYWYDMEFSGPLYPLTSFVRSMNLVSPE